MARQFNDLTGRQFSRLTVISYSGRAGVRRKPTWHCRCSCGVEKTVYTADLLKGVTVSCGCYRREIHCKPDAARNKILWQYKAGANKRNIEFSLTDAEFDALTSSACCYCGQEPLKIRTEPGGSVFRWNGIDRVDSAQGYTFVNCMPCCHICNVMKSALTAEEFIQHIMLIAKHCESGELIHNLKENND